MHRALWALQVFFGVYFVAIGAVHFVLPAGLPSNLAWMYELSPSLHFISGSAEVLGGLGLLLPGLTGIQTRLTPFAAAGLALVMSLAVFWHIPRGEMTNITGNIVFGLALAFLAYGRWKLRPLQG